MTASEMVRTALAARGKTQKELASIMGWTPSNVSYRLKANSLTFDELARILGILGYEVKMVDATGTELPALNNSKSPKVVQMVDGTIYDTSKAESLCNSKVRHSDEWYMELFRSASGVYFLAYYQTWEGGHNFIKPISKAASKRFWEEYSGLPTELMK